MTLYTTVYLFNLHHNLAYYWPVNSTIKIFLRFQGYLLLSQVEYSEKMFFQFNRLTVFAVDFICAVCTISEAIALSAAMDTAAVITLELVGSAGTGSWK